MTESRFFFSARTKARITQAEVAAQLGYENGQFISNIERGVCFLPNDKVRAFCLLTGASILGYAKLKMKDHNRKIRREIFT